MEGYFHSTRLMQALRIGLLRVRQKSARGGLLLVELPCFLLLAYCCLFLCDSEPTGALSDVLMVWVPSALAFLAAVIAACQDRAPDWGSDCLEREGLSDQRGGASPEEGARVLIAQLAPEDQRKILKVKSLEILDRHQTYTDTCNDPSYYK